MFPRDQLFLSNKIRSIRWLSESAKSKMRENIAITLLGNKSDVSEDKRKVSCDEVKEYAKTENIKFEEISALDGEMK